MFKDPFLWGLHWFKLGLYLGCIEDILKGTSQPLVPLKQVVMYELCTFARTAWWFPTIAISNARESFAFLWA